MTAEASSGIDAPERMVEHTLDSVDEAFCIYDAADQLISVNQSYLNLHAPIADAFRLGASFEATLAAEAQWRHEARLIEDVDAWSEIRRAHHAEPAGPIEERHPGGNWIQRRTSRTKASCTVVFLSDVTSLMQGRNGAEQRNALLRGTLENIPQGLVAVDADQRLITWNQLYFDLLDLPHRFAQVGTPIRDIVNFMARRGDLGDADVDETTQKVLIQTLGPGPKKYDRETSSGAILEIRIRSLSGGGSVATYSDVTDTRHAARRLSESEERYALAAAGSNDGLWDWDLRTGRIFYSHRWKEMLGLGDDEVGDTLDEWFDRVHKDDVDRVKAMLDAHLAGAVPHFEIEHRMRHVDDAYRWILVRGLAVRGSEGTAHRIAGSQTDITDRKLSEQQAIHDALHDTLTGLANRTLFLERVHQSLARRQRDPATKFAVIYLDLDRFKLVNESLGHVHGDEMIIATSRRIEQSLKFGDTVARLGGDEFAILMEDIPTAGDAISISDALQESLASPFTLSGKEVFTTASMGIAHSDSDYRRPEDILRDSELAMYRAKEYGKAQSVVFCSNFRKSPVTPIDLDTDLRRALERDEMSLHYQPIVSLSNGKIRGFEALLRWNHAELGAVSPAEFIPLAEETGLIDTLGQWVLRQACGQTLLWNEGRPTDNQLEISVNLSSRQFMRADLVKGIMDSVHGSGLDPSSLKLEITESALMENAQRSVAMLKQLKELDIKVCVDDFGTGYSSLSYLHTFPIDTLKIDRSFINDMSQNYQNLEIVRTITILARNLRLDVIAEGVETPEQHAQLRALGCQFAQGYYFSRPVDVENATRLIHEDRRW
ncbi:MAG: EAL domain-containing protein [Proteobacteria bacterium]|nr:EAL domain-containing protein [Pseudomonadota bacterium]